MRPRAHARAPEWALDDLARARRSLRARRYADALAWTRRAVWTIRHRRCLSLLSLSPEGLRDFTSLHRGRVCRRCRPLLERRRS